MTAAAAQLARPVEPRLRQGRAGFRGRRLTGWPSRCVSRSLRVARSLTGRGAPACSAHSALIVAATASMRLYSRRPARSWWRWLRGGPGSAATSCSRCCCGSGGAGPGWLKKGRAGPAFSWARACGC
jgi:hypothetical protein